MRRGRLLRKLAVLAGIVVLDLAAQRILAATGTMESILSPAGASPIALAVSVAFLGLHLVTIFVVPGLAVHALAAAALRSRRAPSPPR